MVYYPSAAPGPPAQFGPPGTVRSTPDWLPAALLGVVALVGLFCTLLPVWTLSFTPAALDSGVSREVYGSGYDYPSGSVDVSVGFYGWTAANVPAVALIPIALAVAVAIAATLLVRGADRTLWGAAAALSVCSLLLAIAAAIRPAPVTEITGGLADEVSPRDLDRLDYSSDIDVGYGAGLIIGIVCLVAVLGLAGWQYFATTRRAVVPVLGPAPY